MRYLIALFCPPVAIVLCHRPGMAFANFCLLAFVMTIGSNTIATSVIAITMLWLVPVAHAWMIISESKARESRIYRAR